MQPLTYSEVCTTRTFVTFVEPDPEISQASCRQLYVVDLKMSGKWLLVRAVCQRYVKVCFVRGHTTYTSNATGAHMQYLENFLLRPHCRSALAGRASAVRVLLTDG